MTKIDIEALPEQVAERTASTILEAVNRAFEDPAFKEEYKKWKKERRKKSK